jgi:predicted DNA-binding transcriptional regulator AlpA
LRIIVRWPEARKYLGNSRSTVDLKVKTDPDYPKPFRISQDGRAIGWWQDELIAWQKRRAAALVKPEVKGAQ